MVWAGPGLGSSRAVDLLVGDGESCMPSESRREKRQIHDCLCRNQYWEMRREEAPPRFSATRIGPHPDSDQA